MGKKIGNSDPLQDALAAWHRGESHPEPGERFSAGARAELLARVRETRSEPAMAPLARLFMPFSRMAWAAVVPALVLALTVGWLASRPAGESVSGDAVLVQGSKIGGEAVFRIANGGRPHRVYRSTDPRVGAERELVATTDGAFRDRLSGSTGVVYYRID